MNGQLSDFRSFLVEAQDTLFFRDGRPFNQDDSGLAQANSLFPPLPPTMVGAFRATIARRLGWQSGDWRDLIEHWKSDPELAKKARMLEGLGHQNESLGQLRFRGPFLIDQTNNSTLFPCPLALAARFRSGPREKTDGVYSNNIVEMRRLAPTVAAYNLRSDLGNTTRLPQVDCDDKSENKADYKPLERRWITQKGLKYFLNRTNESLRQLKHHIINAGDLWSMQSRMGLERNHSSRAAEEGLLYQSSQIRLKDHVSLLEGIAWQQISGVPDLFSEVELTGPMPLGGESRLAWISPCAHGSLELKDLTPGLQSDGPTLRYLIATVTPSSLTGEWNRQSGSLSGLPGVIAGACVPRPIQIGGWDSLSGGPLNAEPYLPAGATWFMEVALAGSSEAEWKEDARRHCDDLIAAQAHGLGKRTAWGFGQFVIGNWKPVTGQHERTGGDES
ncbi:type III-B CRISPR module-associated Cmr3 family protein [Pelagibius sp. Alg239-R121]|uniref:type III-B CRISPR module-associated Cmr3 family protein n=1 Tax=Pelagibius sp. Alg239-R121 TaxID=2993448 RepID=UPI0024A6F9A8|nr:type III-B CRISPR module-associated Cmr3 family protein [Pelagibius sp. Alg239-R121]